MGNDVPVVGPDAPTANCKMVKQDIATVDWSRPTSGLPVNWNLGAKYHEEGNRRREHGTANPQNLADHL